MGSSVKDKKEFLMHCLGLHVARLLSIKPLVGC